MVHRDLGSLTDACRLAAFERDHTVVIHIGFWRPDADAFQEAVERYPGIVLLTSSAKDALPQPLATTAKPVCVVQGLGLFPILSGWGYETSEAELGVATKCRSPLSFLGVPLPTVPMASTPGESSEWVARLAIENPEAHQAAMAVGIRNDDSLFAKEMALPDRLRSYLNVYRFHSITGEFPSSLNVLDRLHLAGTSLLQAPLEIFELSVRATNIFSNAKISHVYQIGELKTQGLFGLKNMGKKTVTEMATLMLSHWFPGYREGDLAAFEGVGEAMGEGLPGSQEGSPDSLQGEPEALFLSQLEQAINRLPANRQGVTRIRMGLEGKPKTLEDIGKDLGISRERVRQIETASLLILRRNALFKNQLVPRLLSLLKDRQSALLLFGLDVLDPWFAGVAENPNAFEWILEHCCEDAVSLISHNGQYFVTQIRQNIWDSLLESTVNLMKSQVEARITRAESLGLVNGMLIGPGEELRDELWEAVLPNLNFSGMDGEEDILVNVGSNLTSIVEAVLVESPTPLHITEISARVQERSGRQADGNRIRRILGELGFLFGRGTYGLRSHLDLTDEELDILQMEVEDLVLSSDSQRQWHASEIYSSLEETYPDLYSKITPHVIGIALSKTEQLVSLGRMVWTAKQAASNGSAARIDIHQAIVSLIRNAGRPMTAVEIRQRLLRDRGLNSIFQILMEDPLIRVGRGIWGLIERDVPYSKEEQTLLVNSLLQVLNQRQKGIHYTLLLKEISKRVQGIDLNVDPSLIQSIALRSGAMKVDMGQYLYLPEWGNPRWPSGTQVVGKIVLGNPNRGWTAAEILAIAEFELERSLEPAFIHKAIEMLSGTYDLDAKKWFFPIEPVDQDEED